MSTSFSTILLTLLLSFFFSGMGVAFVNSNKLRMELDKKQRNLASAILSLFYRHPQQYISTMLVGSCISIVLYGLLMARWMEAWLSPMGSVILTVVLQIVFAVILALVTGEFLPKVIFRLNPNMWLRVFSPILLFFYVILYPFSKVGSSLSVALLKWFRVEVSPTEQEQLFSKIDQDYFLQDSFDGKETVRELENEVKIFQNALDFSNVKLRDCFVPRTEIIALDYETTDVEILKQTFIETGLSKIPVYKGDIDNITGYIHSSEMFTHQKEWKKYIKSIPIVPENMAAQKLMKTFMSQKKSIAVVVDEFGGTAGIVTLEDIMEEIFGEIEDEHDNRNYVAKQVSENEYLVSGRLEVKAVNTRFGLNIPESEEYETIAGFVLYNHQHFPKLNEVIRVDDLILKCVKVTNNRVEMVRITT